jgi:Fe2+ transport system protein FeoA
MKLTKFDNAKKNLENKGGISMPTKPLNELKPKEKGKIVKISGGGGIHRRLLDMGLVSGSEVEMERVAPLGDPVEVRIKGYHLSLRKEEAIKIQVEVK